MKAARLLKPVVSKRAGQDVTTVRRIGTRCKVQRHAFTPGCWVLWFGKEYALVDAIGLPDTIIFVEV